MSASAGATNHTRGVRPQVCPPSEQARLRVGVNLAQYDIDCADGRISTATLRNVAAAATAASADDVWLSDHPWAVAPDGTLSGAYDLLAALGTLTATPNLATTGIGTLVANVALRGPAALTAAATEAARLAAGPVSIGVGTGWNPIPLIAYGRSLAARPHRLADLRATLDALAPLRATGCIRVVVGGFGPATIDAAAAGADTLNVAWDPTPDGIAAVRQAATAACNRIGRDPATLTISAGVTVLVADSAADRDTQIATVAARAPFLHELDIDALAGRITIGTAAEAAAEVRALGADEIVLSPFVRDEPARLHDLIALLQTAQRTA